MFGAAGAALLKFFGGPARSQALLIGILIVWLLTGLLATFRIARTADL
jgi:hypothetical protein